MRIVSLNVWGGRVPGLIDWLVTCDADIFCLQEVFDSEYVGHYSDQVQSNESALPVVANLYDAIARALPNHRGMMHPACAWEVVSQSDASVRRVQFGNATFVRKSIPIHEVCSRFVFLQYGDFVRSALPAPRVAVAVRVYDPRAEKNLLVAHMHGLWSPEGKMQTPERFMQAKKFVDMVEWMSRPKDKVIACGDFNILPDNPMFALFRKECGLSELVSGYGYMSTRTSYYTEQEEKVGRSLFADYMLISPNVHLRNFAVHERPAVSDHATLLLECE